MNNAIVTQSFNSSLVLLKAPLSRVTGSLCALVSIPAWFY